MKYLETAIVLSEIPDHITLAINISGCPIHCPDCHSKYLWEDVGEELNKSSLTSLIENNPDVTCVCFMGGDNEPDSILLLARYIKEHYPKLATGWYSGRDEDYWIMHYRCNVRRYLLQFIDYLKLGPFIKERGPINNKNTNQRMLHRVPGYENKIEDITSRFWNT